MTLSISERQQIAVAQERINSAAIDAHIAESPELLAKLLKQAKTTQSISRIDAAITAKTASPKILVTRNGSVESIDPRELVAPRDPLEWLKNFELSDAEAEEIADMTFIEPGLIPEGHVVAIAAKPNGGKTTILFHIACKHGERRTVVYVHADTNPADAKRMLETAKVNGVRYLTPDLKVGLGMKDVVQNLQRLANSDADLSGQIWFFDTLKKMANVINKDSLKQTLGLMRKLSSRGMTCVLLCHTNKYRNADGEWQYEGTGDLESDVDELIYFEPRENPDGSLTVSTRCVKRRADIGLHTWDIDAERNVTKLNEYVDIAADAVRQKQLETDQPVIEAISEALSSGPKKQTEVVNHCADVRITEKRVRPVLKRYAGEFWRAEKLFEKNAWRYELLKAPHPCRTGKLAELNSPTAGT